MVDTTVDGYCTNRAIAPGIHYLTLELFFFFSTMTIEKGIVDFLHTNYSLQDTVLWLENIRLLDWIGASTAHQLSLGLPGHVTCHKIAQGVQLLHRLKTVVLRNYTPLDALDQCIFKCKHAKCNHKFRNYRKDPNEFHVQSMLTQKGDYIGYVMQVSGRVRESWWEWKNWWMREWEWMCEWQNWWIGVNECELVLLNKWENWING